MKKDQIKHMVAPADAAELERIEAAQKAGEDVFGDNEDPDAPPVEVKAKPQAKAEEPEAEEAEEADEPAVEAAAKDEEAADDAPAKVEPEDTTTKVDPAKEEAAPAKVPRAEPEDGPARLNPTVDLESIKAKRAELATEKAKAHKELMDGAIDADAYAAIEQRITDERETLLVQATLAEAETKTEVKNYQAACRQVGADSKAAGELDYGTDKEAAVLFDTIHRALIEQNPDRSFLSLGKQAHTAVLAMRGKTPKAAAPAPAPGVRKAPAAPVTLRGVPNAATPNSGGGLNEELSALSGQEFEAKWATLTQAQRDRYLND